MTPASHDKIKEFKADGDDLIVERDLLVERKLTDEVFILDCSEKVERIQEYKHNKNGSKLINNSTALIA